MAGNDRNPLIRQQNNYESFSQNVYSGSYDPVISFGDNKSVIRARWREIIAVAVACIAPLSGGMGHGYSSPTIPELQKSPSEGGLNLNTDQISWFAAALTVGAVLGGPMASPVLYLFGRKVALMTSAFPLCLGWMLVVSATVDTYWILYVGRVVIGIGIGMGTAVAPVYIAEVSSPELRGLLGSCFQTCIMLGLLLTYLIGVPLNYIWLAIACSIVAAILPIFTLFIPESPRWLILNGRHGQAHRSIIWLRNYDNKDLANCEFESLSTDMRSTEETNMCVSFMDLYAKDARKPALFAMLLMLFQQFSGMNALAFYAEPVLIKAGFGDTAGLIAVVMAVVVVIGTFVSSFLMDHCGRKRMLIISGLIMSISCVMFGSYWLVEEHKWVDNTWAWKTLALSSIALYVLGFSAGWGPAPWVVMAEILPNKVRGTGSSLATTVNWLSAFLIVKGFPILQQSIGNAGAFYLFGGINIIASIFAMVFIPETKGKSLEDIEREMRGERPRQHVIETYVDFT